MQASLCQIIFLKIFLPATMSSKERGYSNDWKYKGQLNPYSGNECCVSNSEGQAAGPKQDQGYKAQNVARDPYLSPSE